MKKSVLSLAILLAVGISYPIASVANTANFPSEFPADATHPANYPGDYPADAEIPANYPGE